MFIMSSTCCRPNLGNILKGGFRNCFRRIVVCGVKEETFSNEHALLE